MSSPPKRRLLDKFAGPPTFLGEKTRFEGDVDSIGPFILCGYLRGNGRIQGTLSVTASAHWEGNIQATQAVIAGRLDGSIAVTEKLEIGKAAVIRGSVTAKTLAIAQGAIVEGDITVTGDAPIVHFEEKRASRLA